MNQNPIKLVVITVLIDNNLNVLLHTDPKKGLVLPSAKHVIGNNPAETALRAVNEKWFGGISFKNFEPTVTFLHTDEQGAVDCRVFIKKVMDGKQNNPGDYLFVTELDKWLPLSMVTSHVRIRNNTQGFSHDGLTMSSLYLRALNLSAHVMEM
jgi:hypothetical protein